MTSRAFLVGFALLLRPGGPVALNAQVTGDSYPHGPLPAGLECSDCHSTEGWSPLAEDRSFDHGEVTGFILDGRHAEATCSSCHTDLRFSAMAANPGDCASCHLDVHQATLPADCTLCHTTEAFSRVSGLRIHQQTGLPLEGAHLQLSCESCHPSDRGGAYSPIPSDCMACHREDFEAPKEVDHVTLGFPEDCLSCHTPRSWREVGSFDHASFSGGFPLEGVHDALPCAGCHVQGGGLRFPDPSGPEDCYSCHANDYQEEHGGEGYPTTCTLCHSPNSWEGADDDHLTLSGSFSLEGAHLELPCGTCHVPGGLEPLFNPRDSEDCAACHQADYQRQHAGSGYPTVCTTCHNVATWDDAEADHAALSEGYLLEGAHLDAPCTSCHTADGSGTLFSPSGPGDCVTCHQVEYQESHIGSGYPSECAICHNPSTWDDAVVDHAALSDGYVLEGAHEGLECGACHTEDGSGTLFEPVGPEDCVACHQADYQREHAGTGYPSTCLTCHNVNRWEEVSADHGVLSDGFVLVGNHNALDCSACHVVPGFESIFSPSHPEDCIACHLADFQREHSGTGYPDTCLTCHLVTTWDGAEFDHDATFFPIYSGTHQGEWNDCSTCHSLPGDFGAFTCLTCHEHEKTRTDDDHSEVPDYVYESNGCLSCHPRGNS